MPCPISKRCFKLNQCCGGTVWCAYVSKPYSGRKTWLWKKVFNPEILAGIRYVNLNYSYEQHLCKYLWLRGGVWLGRQSLGSSEQLYALILYFIIIKQTIWANVYTFKTS